MSELAIRTASLTEKIAYSDSLTNSNMLPRQFQDKPANVLWAIEYGETLNITPMAAMTGIHVIENKPGASAALIGGLVRRAGHKLRVSGNNQRATAQIVRSDDPDYTFEVTWELRRNERDNPNAEDAGLLGKAVWKNYPAAMLKARAITQVARDACEEVLFGLHYTPEELGAETDADGNPLEQRAVRQHAPAAPQEYAEEVEDRPAERHNGPVETEWNTATGQPLPSPAPGVPTVTSEQIGEIARLLKAKRGATNGNRNFIISQMVLRPVGNVQTLSASEAVGIIETLTAEPDNAQDAEEQPPTTAAPAGRPITRPQMALIQVALGEHGITDPQAKRDTLARILGTPIASANDLSREQASRVIEAFNTGEVPPVSDGPAPSDEGISEFDALDQMILDVASDEAAAEVEKAIAAEAEREGIAWSDAALLRERLAAHVAQAKAAAA